MGKVSYQRVKEVFYEASQTDVAARSDYLEKACDGDVDLRCEVERLFAADQEAAQFMEKPLLDDSPLRHATILEDPSIPERIGRYRIIRQIGEGGMGYVYQAEQQSPNRIVALKVIRAALPSKRMVQRFEREIEILGRLDHPNIAQIFDAGVADAPCGGGRVTQLPYYAMEFIDGVPLTEYASKWHPSDRQRLELLAAICDAVDYGHRQGVVHRDLKPSNILVKSANSAEGPAEPKIIDFGVARAADLDYSVATLNTHSGMLIGTLAYMSPEQVSGGATHDESELLDARSDVYSLGVIGFELLGGRLPYDLSGRSVPEAARVIRDEDPSSLSSISRAHRGDVETIIRRAMAKEPSRRYQSAAEMAADIRRFLNHVPIMARPPSMRYQLAKFARRHRELVVGLVLVFLILVAGIIGTTTALVHAKIEQARAEKQATRAKLVNDVLQRIFGFARPGMQGGGRDVLVVQMLDDASKDLGTYLKDAPDLELIARKTLGETYQRLGLFTKAEENYERALDLAVAVDRNSPDSFECHAHVSFCRVKAVSVAEDEIRFRQVVSQNLEELTPLLRQAKSVLGPNHPATQNLLATLGFLSYWSWSVDDAEMLLRELLGIVERLPPEQQALPPPVVKARLANVLWMNKKYAAAEALARDAVASENDPAVLMYMVEEPASLILGSICQTLGQLDDGERFYRQALDLQIRALGEEHQATIGTMFFLANLLMERDKWEESLALWQRQRQYWESHSSHSGWIGYLLTYEGNLLAQLERPDEARERYEKAVAHFVACGNSGLASDVRREEELRLGLGAVNRWVGPALRDSFRLMLRREMFQDGTPFEIGGLSWEDAEFVVTSWSGTSAGDVQPSLQAIGVDQLRQLPDPPPGIYKLSAVIPRPGHDPIRCQTWVLLTLWDAELQYAARSEPTHDWGPAVRAGAIEERRLPTLMLSDWFGDGFGPHGTNLAFEIKARSVISVPPGTYRLVIDADDGVRAWIGGHQVIDHWTKGHSKQTADVEFDDQPQEIRIEYFQHGQEAILSVGLEPLG